MNLISKKGLKINFRVTTKNHAADSKIGSSQKIDFRAVGTHESYPIAWELIPIFMTYFVIVKASRFFGNSHVQVNNVLLKFKFK